MDDIAIVEHQEECLWAVRDIKKTVRWFRYLGLKACPSCGERLLN